MEILKKELAKQTSRAEQCTTLRTQLEKQTFELQQVSNSLKELEYERDSYKDWQQQAKVFNNKIFKSYSGNPASLDNIPLYFINMISAISGNYHPPEAIKNMNHYYL